MLLDLILKDLGMIEGVKIYINRDVTPWNDYKAVTKDLKQIYQSISEQESQYGT